MNFGDTFIWSPTFETPHLYIVISSPQRNGGRFVIANLTESLHGPKSFTLKVGDHPYIYKDSDVNFGDAFITDENKIKYAISIHHAIPRESMDLAIVKKIAKIAATHPATSGEVQDMLIAEQ